MNVDFSYLGRSSVEGSGKVVRLSPNLSRPKVFFDGQLKHPVRFREAISALHDVVVSDLRFVPKDKKAYEEYKEQRDRRNEAMREKAYEQAKQEELAKLASQPIPPNLDKDFRRLHRKYWNARVRWANELIRHDPTLFRHLVPCDPIVTVAPDVVLFECFSKDESSYGCLTVDRDSFSGAGDAGMGTTNVDYSMALYEHFQTLRSYRSSQLVVDPTGFEVKVEGRDDHREEKIDLPSSWLRGFGQMQAALSSPCTRVTLSPAAVYALLAYLKRHREKTGPRCIRFRLAPGRAPELVLDPWGYTITDTGGRAELPTDDGVSFGGNPYRSPASSSAGQPTEIKMWGRRRLFSLARILPLADRFEVRLLGDGLPSIWIAHMGDMQMTLSLSGWTTNDWTRAASLETLLGVKEASGDTLNALLRHLTNERREGLYGLSEVVRASRQELSAGLFTLAKQGQVLFDPTRDCFRYRPALPFALVDEVLGPEPPEVQAGRDMARERHVTIERDEAAGRGRRVVVGRVQKTACEMVLDSDGAMKRARCTCRFFHRNRLRAGPCRHLLALRLVAETQAELPSTTSTAARRRKESYQLPAAVTDALRLQSARNDVTASVEMERAWDGAFERLTGAKDWDSARQLTIDALSLSGDKKQHTISLPEDVHQEISRLATRFDVSPSSVLALAWQIAHRPRS